MESLLYEHSGVTDSKKSENHHSKDGIEKAMIVPIEENTPPDISSNNDTANASTFTIEREKCLLDGAMEKVEDACCLGETTKKWDNSSNKSMVQIETESMDNLLHTQTHILEKKNFEKTLDITGSERVEKSVEIFNSELQIKIQNAESSLAFLANAYNSSDSENEHSEEPNEKIENSTRYRNNLNDDDDSSQESDLSESSGDESRDNKDAGEKNEKHGNRRNEMRDKGMKGEFDDLPPIEELQIVVPEVLCDPLGEVGWMVEQMVVVKPKSEKPTLNLETILFLDRGRRVLGRIFDVFGQVSEPHYCVRFNSCEHITQSEIKIGMTVYFCPNTPYTSLLFLHDLFKMKATEEISDQEHPEFSDDAEEEAYYAALNKKQTTKEIPKKVTCKRRKTSQEPSWRSNHPWSSRKNQEMRNQKTNRRNEATEGFAADQGQNLKRQGQNSKQQQQHNGGGSPRFCQQNPSSYDRWPIAGSHSENYWQNGYPPHSSGEQHSRPRHPQFYPQQQPPQQPRQMQIYSNHYHQSMPYLSNTQRFPLPNFQWHSQIPRFPDYSWPAFPPPPPPGV